MIAVRFEQPTDAEWTDWLTKADQATEILVTSGHERPASLIDDKLYKAQRPRILEAFRRKCAYCELRIVAGQRFGDVEHYRPKGRVMTADGKVVKIRVGGVERPHPGYYWLAYDWRNLLPACLACNRPGTDPSDFSSGKWDRFPVEDDVWASSPADIARERPMILNPYFDDPNEHLVFSDDTGIVGHRTERGEINIRILGLNRDGLPEERRNAYHNARAFYRAFHEALLRLDDAEADQYEGKLAEIESGTAEYAAFCRAAVREANEKYEARRRDRLRRAGLNRTDS